MNILGYTFIKTDRLRELEWTERQANYFHNQKYWFSGWKDLQILWDYFFSSESTTLTIDETRRRYAIARNTNEYGEPLK